MEPEVQYSWTRSSIQFNKLEIVYILFEPEVQYGLTTRSCSYISFEPEVQYSSKSDILDIMMRSLRFAFTLLDKQKLMIGALWTICSKIGNSNKKEYANQLHM